MDIASFIVSVTDMRLRREIIAGLDEATIQTLPANLLAEARQVGDALRRERQQQEQERERMQNRYQAMGSLRDQMRRMEDRILHMERHGHGRPRESVLPPADKSLEGSLLKRHRDLAAEQDNQDIELAIGAQLGHDERLLEGILALLLGAKGLKCDLLPSLSALLKVSHGN